MSQAQAMHGKGILFVNSKISRPDILDIPTFLKWYDEDHIVEVVETSGIQSARRFVDIDPKANRPYLAMYPMDDLGFTQGEEFRRIRVKSDILPGSGTVYDLADFDVRYYNLVAVFDETNKGKGVVKSLVVDTLDLNESATPEQVDSWFRQEHCSSMTQFKGYLRTTGFKLVDARSNAQSRALKGLGPSTDEPAPQPVAWLSLHEFDCDVKDLNDAEIRKFAHNPRGDDVVEHTINIYKLAKEFGEKNWFYEGKL
ncbi:hypothetical protein ACJZ2D_000382 [Fusarium nematophilum]